MGTHIDTFFPHTVERSLEVVRKRLTLAFGDLRDDLAVIRERGRFSANGGDWWLVAEGGTVSGRGAEWVLYLGLPYRGRVHQRGAVRGRRAP